MKKFVLVALIAISGFVGVVSLGTAPATVVQKTAPDTTALFTLVNEQREDNSIAPLLHSSKLDASAQDKCNDMVKRDYWSHEDPDGKMPWDLIVNRYGNYSAAGENLAYGFNTADYIVFGWMHSPGHRANILNASYKEVGYATCHSDNYIGQGEQYIVVQHFATPL